MKKLLAVVFIGSFCSIAGYSQDNERNEVLEVIDYMARTKQANYSSKTAGSPYINKFFQSAKVDNVSQSAAMRYDAYQDEFEFIKGRDTLVLNKEKYNSITFMGSNTKYKLVDYTKKGKKINGYLISLYEKGDYALFKKQNISYEPEKVATTSFDRSIPASFVKDSDTFFIKDKDRGISELPKNKKGLIKLYPDKKDQLEAFIKQNDTNFDNEADLKKLIEFLASQG